MPRENTKLTRLELIKNKSRIKVAARGLELLKMKRSSLVLAFFNLAREISEMMVGLREQVIKAENSVKFAEINSGRIQLERIAVEESLMGIDINVQNIMGVKITNISVRDKKDENPVYKLVSIPSPVYDAKESFTKVFRTMIEVAEKENSMRRLLKEIEKLNRRANAIENIAIPRMRHNIEYIERGLENIERDQIVSLKFIKGRMSEK